MLKRVKRIRGYSAYARFWFDLETAEALEPVGEIERQSDILSPYAWSPCHSVYEWNGRKVITVETAHRQYDVFEVPPQLRLRPVGTF